MDPVSLCSPDVAYRRNPTLGSDPYCTPAWREVVVPRVGKKDGVDPRGDTWGKTIWDPKLKIPVFPHYTWAIFALRE